MPDVLFEADFKRKSLEDWRAGISGKFRRRLARAMDDIVDEIDREMDRQRQTMGDGAWPVLSEKYGKRKASEFKRGKIPFNSILKRTGSMMEGYRRGAQVEVNRNIISVVVPYPPTKDRDGKWDVIKAVAHQSTGRVIRPFDVDRFFEIAEDILNAAMADAAK